MIEEKTEIGRSNIINSRLSYIEQISKKHNFNKNGNNSLDVYIENINDNHNIFDKDEDILFIKEELEEQITKIENEKINFSDDKNTQPNISFKYKNETILIECNSYRQVFIALLKWLYNENFNVWKGGSQVETFLNEDEKNEEMKRTGDKSGFEKISDNKYLHIKLGAANIIKLIIKYLTEIGIDIKDINLIKSNKIETSSKNKTTNHKKVIMKVEKETPKVFSIEDFKLNMIDLIFNDSGIKKCNIELKITSDSNEEININENFEHIDLDTFLKNVNKEKDYYDYFLKIFKVPSVHKFITSFSSNERKIFCDLLFSITDYSDINKTIDEIRKIRKIINKDFIKKVETFKPSTMYGKCEFLPLLLIKTKRSKDDIILGGKSFNIKYTEDRKGTIRTGKDGIHTNFDFWNKCILKIIKAICYNNVNGDITKNFNHIDNDTIEYFKTNFNDGHYNAEFNGTDFSKIKEIISFIELKEYDVNYLESDIKNAIDFLTKDRIIQFTNDDIIIFGEYEFSHITQGRIRPILKK